MPASRLMGISGTRFAKGVRKRGTPAAIHETGSVGPDGRLKDVLDSRLKEPGNPKSKTKAGMVFPPFESVDGLTGNLELFCEVGLRPLPLGAEILQSVSHQGFASLSDDSGAERVVTGGSDAKPYPPVSACLSNAQVKHYYQWRFGIVG